MSENKEPRGIRNKNPGNIRLRRFVNWKGKVKWRQNTDGDFEQFLTMRWGLRAMVRIVAHTYIRKKGLNTIEKIIETYAPAIENHTENYIEWVSKKSGVPRFDVIHYTDYERILKVVNAMVQMENGAKYKFSKKMLYRAWNDAIHHKERYQIPKICLTEESDEETPT